MDCIKSLFDLQKDSSLLASIVGRAFRKKTLEGTYVPVSDVYVEIKELLLKLDNFAFLHEPGMNTTRFNNALKSMYKVIVDSATIAVNRRNKDNPSGELSAFITELDNNFVSDAGVADSNVVLHEESIPDIRGAGLENEEERRNRKLGSVLELFYGTSIGAILYREYEFNRDLIRRVIINTDTRELISNSDDLNRLIVRMKNEFLSDIVLYLDSIGKGSNLNRNMFNESGSLIPSYVNALNRMYNVIRSYSPEELVNTVDQGWKTTVSGLSSPFFKALNSYVNLVYFDDLLKLAIGKTVEIDPKFNGFEVDAIYSKYAFSKGDEHKVKGWETSENRNAITEIAKFSKLVLSIIPMKSNRNGKDSGRNISVVSFSNAITSLFRISNNLISEYNGLKELIYRFHSNPSLYSEKILEYIIKESKPGIKNLLLMAGLTEYDLDVLYSVYNYVFDSSNLNSVKSIETEVMKRKFSIGRYSIIDSINGVMDRVMDASYLLTVYGDDGAAKTTIKKKYANRREQFSTIQNINSSNIGRSYEVRKRLLELFPIKRKEASDTQKYLLNVGGHEFHFNSKSSLGILGHLTVRVVGPKSYEEVFDRASNVIDLSNSAVVSKILSNLDLSFKEKTFRSVLEFIDTYLNTNFLTEDGLNTLYLYKSISSDSNYIESMFINAMKAAVINDLYYLFGTEVRKGTFLSGFEFSKFLDTAYSPFKGMKNKDIPNYFIKSYGIKDIITVSTNETWVDRLAEAKAILSGEVSKAVTKDLQGNSIANYRTSYLGGNMQYYLAKSRDIAKKVKEVDPNAATASEALLFTNNNSLIKAVVMNNDVQSRNGVKKSIKDMKASELYYTSIFHNFFGTFIGESMSGSFVILPTTYSDKTTFLNYAIDGTKKLKAPGKSYDDKSLVEMTNSELLDVYLDTVGLAYKNVLTNVLSDYLKIFGADLSIEEINNRLKSMTEELLVELATLKKVSVLLDTHYRKDKATKRLKFNELLLYYATNLYDKKSVLELRMKLEEFNFLNDLLDSNVSFYTKYYDDKGKDSNNPVMAAINSGKFMNAEETANFKKNWIKNNKLILAKVDGKDILYGSRLKGYETFELNPLLAKYLYTDSLLSNNLRFSLTGSEIAHPDKAIIDWKRELKAAGLEGYPPFYTVNNKGKTVPNVKVLGNLTDLYVDILHRIKDPDSTPEDLDLLHRLHSLYNSVIRKIEAAALGTLLKRNVIIPATLLYMLLNVLNGVPSKIKVATIRDIGAEVFNFRGDVSGVDAHDGSAWINPFISILENKSLQDQEVGVDKKPIWHHYDENLMSATLLKFATFTMTNERMLTSLNSDLSLYKLFKRMTNQQWLLNGVWTNSKGAPIDLVKGRGFGNRNINFSRDILQDRPLFYNLNGTHYLIVDLKSDEKGYYTLETEVNLEGNPLDSSNVVKVYHYFDGDSNHIRLTEDAIQNTEGLHSINSLYELHKVLGGIFSESLDDDSGYLKYSEASNHAVVNYMNNVSTRVTNNTSDLSQNTYYQPLKEMMISYAANNSAVKNGTSNINQSDAWYGDKELTYMEIDSDGLGIQMDADHDIDEAEMTEFSQVISSLEAGGRLHHLSKLVYKDLGEIAILSSNLEVKAVAKYLSNQTGDTPIDLVMTDLYDVVGRTIINNYKSDPSKAELASELIVEITKKFNLNDNHILDEFKIPFSDVNIYSNILSTFVSTINNKSIKRKYPGSGCVMVPGYLIVLNFKIGGRNYLFSDLISRAKAANISDNFYEPYNGLDNESYVRNLVKAYLLHLQSKEELVSSDVFIPTDVVNIILEDALGVSHEVPVDLSSVSTYYALKDPDKTKIAKHILKNKLTDLEGNVILSIKGISSIEVEGEVKYILEGDVLFLYRNNITKPRNLQPARITWLYTDANEQDRTCNVYDLLPIKDSFVNGIVNRKAIQGAFDKLKAGTFEYEGVEYLVRNLKNMPAELVMSNLYASKFGTHGKSLADILDLGKSFFKKTQKPLVKSNHFDVAFTKGNNKNTYLTFQEVGSDVENGFNPKYEGWKYIKREGGKVFSITKDNRVLFEVGRDVVREDLFYNDKDLKYYNTEGEEVDSTNLRRGNDGKVLEYIEFVSNYTIVEKDRTGKMNNFLLYRINRDNIKKVLVNNNSERFEKDVNFFISKILTDIYNSDLYKGLLINNTLPIESARLMSEVLPNMLVDDALKDLIYNTNRILLPSLKSDLDVYRVDTKAYKNILNEYNEEFLDGVYASFLKSLTFTASRIPAQTLLSFMLMELTGFTLSSKNIVYVSHWLTWLLGSKLTKIN